MSVMAPIITLRDYRVNTYRVRQASQNVKNGRMAFRDNLRALRSARKMSQEQLALACGWGQSRIANYESAGENGRSPHVDEVPQIAQALGVQVQELFGLDPVGASQPTRLAPAKLSAAISTIVRAFEVAGLPLDLEQESEMIALAYETLEAMDTMEGRTPARNILDLSEKLAAALKARGSQHGNEGGPAGGNDRRQTKRKAAR